MVSKVVSRPLLMCVFYLFKFSYCLLTGLLVCPNPLLKKFGGYVWPLLLLCYLPTDWIQFYFGGGILLFVGEVGVLQLTFIEARTAVCSLLSISSIIVVMSSSSHARKNLSWSQTSRSDPDDSEMELDRVPSFPRLPGWGGVTWLIWSFEKVSASSWSCSVDPV